MEYKIFYSYQSDLDKEVNENFIENALKQAAKELKQYKLKVIKGFSGTSGQKPLAQTMFDESASCDIFVGDISFTSERNNHIEKHFFYFRKKEYLSRLIGDVKKSPNPNVLIETGYSWSKKDYDRTILVINKAFGESVDLPIDMGHVRWPVDYNLSSIDKKAKDKYDAAFEGLVKDLKVALGAAIKTTQIYHRDRFNPFKIYSEWKSKEFSSDYFVLPELKEIILHLRGGLEKKGNPQRLIGPKNSGKTRLVRELFNKVDDVPKSESVEQVLYYDIEPTSFASIERQVRDLAILNQDKIVVVDNCPIMIHDRLCEDLFGTNVRILTIGNSEGRELEKGATIQIDADLARKVVEQSASKRFKGPNAGSVIELAQSNIREAMVYVNSSITDEVTIPADYTGRWQQLLGKLYERGALTLLEALSIFKHVGLTGRYKNQVEYIQKELCDNLEDFEFLNFLEFFLENGIVKKQGDFIMLETFNAELATSWWSKQTPKTLVNFFRGVSNVGLSGTLGDRLIELSQNSESGDIIKIVTGNNGLFNYDFIDTDQGSRIILSLSEIAPADIMNGLKNSFEGKSRQDLLFFEKGRRNLVWALERLSFRKETFIDATKLLYRLAQAENENISNNATNKFYQLFQPFLSGTEVDLKTRVALLEELSKVNHV